MAQGYSGRTRQSRVTTERGNILDRNGKTLATQIALYDVYIRPPAHKDRIDVQARIAEMAALLAPILGMNAEEIQWRINGTGSEFVIKRRVSWDAWEKIQNIQRQPENKLAGVRTEAVTLRDYPEKNLAAQIIGFVGDNNGRWGVEYAFNKELSEGNNVILTIDINVQHILEKAAWSTLHRTGAETVMFLATDPRNGDILGSAVIPAFDPNNYNTSFDSHNYESNEETYKNYTATLPYEPGSVFKIFSIAALMEAGVISEHSELACTGVYEKVFSSGEMIRIECADGRAHGRVRPRELIMYSCNVGAALAAERLDNQAFYEFMRNFGFGAKTGAWVNAATADSATNKTLLTETAGLLKNPRFPGFWSGRTKQSIAFGQEISVSALQVMQAASIITNNGVLVPPKIVSRVTSPDGRTIIDGENNENWQVISPGAAQRMLAYMADTAKAGTGQLANIRDFNLAIKTGTAEMADPFTGNYSRTNFITSCIALLPAEAPSLVLYVVIIKPRGEILGGRIAAPAIRDAADELINYFGIPRLRNPIWVHPGSMSFTDVSIPAIGSIVPNYYGFSKRDLLPLLSQNHIRVEILGEGWVRRQSPQPGTTVTPGMVLELILE